MADNPFILDFLLLLIGAAGGFLSGLLGVGGGIIFVPALYAYFSGLGVDADHAMRAAVGSSMALVMVTGATSAFWHHKKQAVDFGILKSWGPFIVLGVAVGTTCASVANGEALKRIFAATAFFISIYMALSREPAPDAKPHAISMRVQRTVCTCIGAVASMIGVGGALLTIPTMTYIGTPMRRAVGTGGALGTVISLPATAGYIFSGLHAEGLPAHSLGYVNLLALAVVVPVSFMLSPVGVHVSHLLRRDSLRRIFAGVLVLVALRMFVS